MYCWLREDIVFTHLVLYFRMSLYQTVKILNQLFLKYFSNWNDLLSSIRSYEVQFCYSIEEYCCQTDILQVEDTSVMKAPDKYFHSRVGRFLLFAFFLMVALDSVRTREITSKIGTCTIFGPKKGWRSFLFRLTFLKSIEA